MTKIRDKEIEVEAYLWNGSIQIPGLLRISDFLVEFIARGFEKSHLGLIIEISNIKSISTYLIYDLDRKGLLICDIQGEETLFVIPELKLIFQELNTRLPK